MVTAFSPNNLIGSSGTTVPNAFLPKKLQARASGPVEEYKFDSVKPKKQLKEIRKVLLPEKKRFLGIKYGFKFNLRHRCVVCGTHHEWDLSDPYRPGIPLHQVSKGKPLKGTYCQKHAGIYKQMEMLEQQILADEHGLEFRRFIPKPRMPQMPQILQSKGPLTTLSENDIRSLIAAGWLINPPKSSEENPQEEYHRLMGEVKTHLERMDYIIKGGEE